ncbi:MAG: WG repeat-containing protein [Oscillospiraceae bacterium]|nr:WG repeat-containing protein [Oscillospiraceae bacterium]
MRRSTVLCGILASLLLSACVSDNYEGNSHPEAAVTAEAEDIITEEIEELTETEPPEDTTETKQPEETTSESVTEASEAPVPYEDDETEYDPDAENLFYHGLAIAKKDGKRGFIDKSGSWVIKPEYDMVYNFYLSDITSVRKGEKYMCIDTKGNIIQLPDEVHYAEIFSKDGLIMATVEAASDDYKTGLLDRTGKWIVAPEFDYIGYFSESGIARVYIKDSDGNKKWGLIDISGSRVTELKYEWIDDFSAGLAVIELDGKYGYMDETGNLAIEPQFVSAGSFYENGIASICDENHNYGFIDKTGNIIVKPQFYDIDFRNGFSENGLALAGVGTSWQDVRYGYIDKTGNWVIEPQFVGAKSFNKSGLAPVTGSDTSWEYYKWGYIDASGSFVIEPAFEEAHSFDEDGLALVGIKDTSTDDIYPDTKYGVIDMTGNYIIKPEYSYMHLDYDTDEIYGDDLIYIQLDDEHSGYADRKGNIVIEPKYSALGGFAPNGLSSVRVGDKVGFINRSGEIVIEPQFDYAYGFYDDGYGVVAVDGKYGIIDSSGNYIAEPVFDDIPGIWMSAFDY